jgi:hypothetical protein
VLQGLATVALDPVAPQVVAVGDGDVRVGVQVGPKRVERQRDLVDAALGVKVSVGVGVVGPTRGHLLGAGGDAVVALHLVGGHRLAALDGERAEVEVVERRELLEEELRRANQVLGARLDGDPGLREVRVVQPGAAGARIRSGLARRDWIAAAHHRTAHHLVGDRDARQPERVGTGGPPVHGCERDGDDQHSEPPHVPSSTTGPGEFSRADRRLTTPGTASLCATPPATSAPWPPGGCMQNFCEAA